MEDVEVFNIRPYLIFRFIFGYYHNVKSLRNSTRYVLRCVSLAIFIVFIFLSTLCKCKSYFGIIWVTAITFQYVINIICSIYTGDEYILEYYRYNPLIDNRNKNVYARLNIILLTYIIMIITAQIAFYGMYIYFLNLHHQIPCEAPWQFYLVGVLRLATSMGRIPMFLTFGLLYCRVRIFCKKVREHILKNTGTFKCKTYMKIYEEIISTLQKTDSPMKFLVPIMLFIWSLWRIIKHKCCDLKYFGTMLNTMALHKRLFCYWNLQTTLWTYFLRKWMFYLYLMCFQLFSHLLLVFLDISNSQYNMVRVCFWKHRAFVSCSSYNIFCSSDYTVFDYHLGNVMVTFNKQHGCIISIVNYGDYIWGNWKHESCCRR